MDGFQGIDALLPATERADSEIDGRPSWEIGAWLLGVNKTPEGHAVEGALSISWQKVAARSNDIADKVLPDRRNGARGWRPPEPQTYTRACGNVDERNEDWAAVKHNRQSHLRRGFEGRNGCCKPSPPNQMDAN